MDTVPRFARHRTRAASITLLGISALLVPVLGPAPARAADVIGGPALAKRGVQVGAGATALPPVLADAWIVADATTGAVLAAKDAHSRHRPASTLKTLTAATVMPQLDPTAEHVVTAQEQAPVYGSRAGLVVGASYTVDDLWHALLLPSGNDAAAALAAAFGGVHKTVAAMNAEARSLQAFDTHAVNPSGLDADGQYSSAYDLALIARSVLTLPEFRAVSGTVSYDLPGKAAAPGKKRPTYKIYGQNRLLNAGFKGVIAGKTGYTSLAGRTFWVAATRGGDTIVVTLMGIKQPTETAAAALLTWGLKNADRVTPLGRLVDPVPVSGAGSTTPATDPGQPTAPAPAPGATAASSTGAVGAVPTWVVALAGLVVVLGIVAWLVLRRRPRTAAPPPPSSGPPPTTASSTTTSSNVRAGAGPAQAPDPAPASAPYTSPALPPAAVITPSVRVLPGVTADPAVAAQPDAAPAPGTEAGQPPPDRPEADEVPEHPVPEHVRPATITPTGNVTVLPPVPQHPGD